LAGSLRGFPSSTPAAKRGSHPAVRLQSEIETDMILRAMSGSQAGTFEVYDIANNQITAAASMGQVGLEWTVAGFGDFSSNLGETDMLMRNTNNGAFEVYDISNNQITSAASMGQVGLCYQRRELHLKWAV
jgi:hypothetical protein